MSDPLSIHNEMAQFDRKNRDFYDSLSDEQKKKFAPFLMIRWGSAVKGSRELQEFYVMSTNLQLNRHFFNINGTRHKKLLWLMATTVSPDMGSQRHEWIAPHKRDKPKTGKRKILAQLRPNLREDELDIMCKINSDKDIDEYVKQHGNDKV